MEHKQGKEIGPKYVFLYKKLGETPLEAIERYRQEQILSGLKWYKDLPMTYAGRLDPLAEGEMLILLGDECKNKEKYLALDKEYEVEVLIGICTDTHDILGLLIDDKTKDENKSKNERDLKDKISDFIGRRIQKYPLFSSKTLGKEFSKDNFPQKEIEIYSIDLLQSKMIGASDLREYIEKRIDLINIKYDFRQDKIKSSWDIFFSKNKVDSFPVLKLRVKCSSGTYMRVLAQELGGLALSIERKKIFLT